MFRPMKDPTGRWAVQQDLEGHGYLMSPTRYDSREDAQVAADFLEAVWSGAPRKEIERLRQERDRALGRA